MKQTLDIQRAADLIAGADCLVIAAGAGIGVDSGLPDFRGTQGFWKAYPALARAGIDFQGAASASRFKDDPEHAWGFYGHRLALYRRTMPHDGFGMLKKWGEAKPLGYSVFTSNVDGQFQAAGFDPRRIHECHGSIHHLQCSAACSPAIWPADGFIPEVDDDACRLTGPLPRCGACHAVARPNILMFDDWDWIGLRAKAQQQRQDDWLAGGRRPVVIEIGAGSAIPTVRHFSKRILQRHGGRLVRINLREPEVAGEHDAGLGMGALAALQAIDAKIGPASGTGAGNGRAGPCQD
ncbi:MAG: SIR2 family NAD-dependent protein deacylase [Telluria sp.]